MNSCNYLINNKHESSKTSTQKLRCCCYWRSGFNLGLGKNSGMVPTQMNCKICGTPPLHWTSTQHILHQAVFSSILPSPVLFISTKCSFCFYDKFIRGGHIVIIPPANFVCGGYTVFTLSVRPCKRPSVTFGFLNILKSHCWIFIKPCKYIHIWKTNTLDKKVRAIGQFY